MQVKDYIRKQIQEYIVYENSFTKTNSEYRHPKTNKIITWSEKCSLVEKDLDKRVQRIEDKIYEKR